MSESSIIPYADIKVQNLEDLPTTLTSAMERYADSLAVNPHLTPIEAYQKIYKCNKTSAAKNYRRVFDRKDFRQYVGIMKSAITEHIGITEDQIISILAARAKCKLTDIVKWNKSGDVEYIPSEDLSEDAQLSIQEFEATERPILDQFNNPKYDKGRLLADRRIKVKMKGSDKPLELLGRYLNLWDNTDTDSKKKAELLNRFLSMVHGKKSEDQ